MSHQSFARTSWLQMRAMSILPAALFVGSCSSSTSSGTESKGNTSGSEDGRTASSSGASSGSGSASSSGSTSGSGSSGGGTSSGDGGSSPGCTKANATCVSDNHACSVGSVYDLYDNQWNCAGNDCGPESAYGCLNSDGTVDFVIDSSQPAGNTAVLTYPAMQLNVPDVASSSNGPALGSLKSVTSTFTVDPPDSVEQRLGSRL
jgi:hypothetical protein